MGDGATIAAHYKGSPALMGTGGAMTWSIGWDASGGWKWIKGVSTIWGVGPRPSPVPTPSPPTPVPAPTPTPVPAPTPPPQDCPGGTMTACIGLCPVDAQYTACIQHC